MLRRDTGMIALLSTITILSFTFCSAADGVNFCYDNQSAWRYLHVQGSESCGGSRQSPIDIITSRTTTDANLRLLERREWNGTVSGKLTNTGRTVKLIVAFLAQFATYTPSVCYADQPHPYYQPR